MPASETIIIELRLNGASQFQAQARSSAASLDHIGTSAKKADTKSKAAGGAMLALGTKAKFAAGAGLAAVGYGLVRVAQQGVEFNAKMEQSRVAFTNLLGSGQKANAMLNDLYTLAAHTPFEFPELVGASRTMLGFGLEAEKVLPTMQAVGDAVAGIGGGANEIGLITRNMAQMVATGRANLGDLRSMALAGVPALKILAKEMGVTVLELQNRIRKGTVEGDKAVDLLVRGMNKKYKGMAEAQSKTFNGQISTMKDNINFTLGVLTGPLFLALRNKVLPIFAGASDAVSKWAKSGGAVRAWTATMKTLKPVLDAIGDAFAAWFWAAKPLFPYLRYLLPVLKILGIYVGVMLVVNLKLLALHFRIVGRIIRILIGTIRTLVRWFTTVGNAGAKALERTKKIISGFEKFGKEIIQAIIRGIKSAPGAIVDAIKSLVPGGGLIGKAFKLLGGAAGGIVPHKQPVLVGERGPEIATFPGGTRIVPLGGSGPRLALNVAGGGGRKIEVPVYLNGREIARAIGQDTADVRARRGR